MPTDPSLLRRAVPALRVELADAATRGRVVTLAEAGALVGQTHPGGVTDALLAALGRACADRGEPDLGSLVLRYDETEPVSSSCAQERRRCWLHWGGPAAEAVGIALTAPALSEV